MPTVSMVRAPTFYGRFGVRRTCPVPIPVDRPINSNHDRGVLPLLRPCMAGENAVDPRHCPSGRALLSYHSIAI